MKNLNSLLTLIIIFTLIIIGSCKKEESNSLCYVSNPIEELDWLKIMINDFSDYDYIMKANYNGETVFYNGNCNPAANYVSTVYNCNGDAIGYTNDLWDELSNDVLVWQNQESKCNFND